MIIVSQDKNMIINFNSIVSTYVIKNYVSEEKGYQGYNIDFATDENINFVLATYDTEERAQEVLREIIKAYLDCNVQNALAEYAYVKNKVFEMPTK